MADIKNFALNSNELLEEQIEELGNSVAYRNETIRVMPDGHPGKGAVVGSTITFSDKIAPYTVGVDICCRVSLFKLPAEFSVENDLEKLDEVVHNCLPTGFNIHSSEPIESCVFPYSDLKFWGTLDDAKKERVRLSMGTLGGGNHTCAVDVDDNGNAYLLVHCGSRSLGVLMADYYHDIAKKAGEARVKELRNRYHQLMRELRDPNAAENNETVRELLAEIDKDHVYLDGEDCNDYLSDMLKLELWSLLNHHCIYYMICDGMGWDYGNMNEISTTCVHNYASVSEGIIRKGAISAHYGEIGIIPLNMRDGTLLVKGKGNPDWNYSLPHGAGRLMSRAEARKNVSLDEYEESMKDVYSTTVNIGSIDEAPMVYKNYKDIIDAIEPNAEILCHLREVYNYKDDTQKSH